MIFNPEWADAISSNESGGRYGILGPVTRTGDRAYGKYQVMGSNVGPWTKEVLGRSMTPQEFVNSPAAQDAVFQAKFGQAVAKYGNPQDAASIWFTGKPLAQGANRSDVLGTTGQAYVDKFNKALGDPVSGAGAVPQASAAPPQAAQPSPAPTQAQPSAQAQQAALPAQAVQMPAMRPQQQPIDLGFLASPAPAPRRINVTGLLQLLQNSPLKGLLQG